MIRLIKLVVPVWLGIACCTSSAAQGLQAEFLGSLGNDDTSPSTMNLTNTAPEVFLPPERLAAGPGQAQQYANVFIPVGPAPKDGWPVAFITLAGGGAELYPVTSITDDDFAITDRLWEVVNAGIAVVTWGAPGIGGGQGMFYPPGHLSGRYESYAPGDDNLYNSAAATVRNGTGAHAVGYRVEGLPILGQDFVGMVDTGGHVGANFTVVVGYDSPITGLPTPYGELLLRVEALGGVNFYSCVSAPVSGMGAHIISVPFNLALEGRTFPTQGVIIGGGIELLNAVDLTVGF